mgnify:CR=1 FL=1
MNKVLFIWESRFADDLILVANNERDLIEYLEQNHAGNVYSFEQVDDSIEIRYCGSVAEVVPLKWIKHI